MSNSDFEDEDYEIIQERKDIEEENLLNNLLDEEKQIKCEFVIEKIDSDDFDDDKYECIDKIKDIEKNLLSIQLQEEFISINSNELKDEDVMDDFEKELNEKIVERKDIEEILLINQIKEEEHEFLATNIDVADIKDDFEIESYEEIERRKENEENSLKSQLEEESFDNYIDELGDEAALNNESLENKANEIDLNDEAYVNQLLKQIEDEQNAKDGQDKECIVKNNEASVFPIPDCISCSSNDDKKSVTSITENESKSTIPAETPFHHKSMIPVQTGRKIPLPREIFETPSFRTQGRDKFDPHLLSEMKPKQKSGSKLVSSIPVNQGRKQIAKKSKQHDEKEVAKTNVKRNCTQTHNSNSKKNAGEEKNSVSFSKQDPPKTISKKQLKNLTDRLAPITPSSGKQHSTKEQTEITTQSIKSIPQTPCCTTNSDIFNRLFVMSTCKKKLPNSEEEKIEETPTEVAQPIMSVKSNNLALKKDIVKISSVVGEVDECNKDNLERIMKELKIIDSTTTEEELQMIEKEFNQCIVDKEKNIYSAKQLEARILDSISLKKHHKFNIYVNRRLTIVRANEKPVIVEQPEEKVEPVKRPTTMHRVTFDRLIAVKPTVSESDNQNVSDITLKKETEHVKISKASQNILQKSQRNQEVMSMSLEQRNNYLMKRRNESIQKLEESLQQEEEKEMKVKPSNLGALPKFYGQVQQELKQRQPKQNQNKKDSEKDSFKPKTMSYNDFQKMKEKVYGSEPKVAGVEERIKRLRLARIERNELQEALDPRALPTELKNMKKKKNPVKKNANINVSINQAEIQESPTNEQVDAVDNILGI